MPLAPLVLLVGGIGFGVVQARLIGVRLLRVRGLGVGGLRSCCLRVRGFGSRGHGIRCLRLRGFWLSTDKAAYPINAMGISKAMMEHVIFANARVAAERGGTVICCTRYGNVMCSRGSVIPRFVEQIKSGDPITITDPNMTRFLMNLDEAVELVRFAFNHANPGDLFIQKADASTIGDLAKAVQKLFGDTGTNIIGTRHGEKLFETLMTCEERLRAEDMGNYYRVVADSRDLNYDKFVVHGNVKTMADEAYTSHNTNRLDVDGVVDKLLTTDYVRDELNGVKHE